MNLPASNATDVDIRALSKSYPSRSGVLHAVDGIDIRVRAGEFVCILGPSGCGKSSLLNIVAGFEAPTSGEVRIGGELVTGPTSGQGVVFQDTAALFPWLSVRRNIAFGLRNSGLSRAQVNARVEDALRLVGLASFGEHWPQHLSGGMRQLVAIARVLVTDARVLLMDEPFAALDAMTRQQMQHQLLDIWRRTGLTVLLITHSVDEALYLGDRVLVFSSRPAKVALEIPVALPYPRDITTVAFNTLKSRALSQLGLLERPDPNHNIAKEHA